MDVPSERIAFRETGASVALDAIRGLAALVVMFDHCRHLFFVDYETALRSTVHPHLMRILNAFGDAGPQAVVIFFVLSGYLISGSVFRSLDQGRWSWKDYLTHRVVRLWLVLIPSLILCACWDTARIALGGARGAGLLQAAHASGITLKLFLSNVFFLQVVRTTTFGSDRVLWSLAAEFWYYMLFPLGVLALRRSVEMRARLAYGAAFLLVAVFVGRPLIGLFPVWLLGVLLVRMKPPSVGAAVRWSSAAVFVIVFFAFAMTRWPWHIFKMDYALGMATVLFLWVVLSARARMDQQNPVVRASRRLAGSSYSLYLVHYPFLAFTSVLVGAQGRWPPEPRYLLAGAAACAVALIYSLGVAASTEWHNDEVRRWVEQRISTRRKISQPAAARS